MKENWLPIVGYEGAYEVSDRGRVRSLSRMQIRNKRPYPFIGRVLKAQRHQTYNWWQVLLSLNGKKKLVKVHRLVAQAFIPNPLAKPEVNHLDGSRLNNDVGNLEWCTHQENMTHAALTGVLHHPSALTVAKIKLIRQLYDSHTVSNVALAELYQVSEMHIRRIGNRIQWKHV